MFVSESLEAVEFPSTWKKERLVRDSACQTSELQTGEVECQSMKHMEIAIQTDEYIEEQLEICEDDSKEYKAFLKKAGPMMIKELKDNLQSKAFDGFSVNWGGNIDAVTNIHTLSNADLDGQLQVTGLSWNCTGAVIAASFGRFDHEDWCTHKSALCTWNLDRRGLKADKPDVSIDVSSCLMCIATHPRNPSWIAGGTFDGEVIVWDMSREDDPVIATSGIGDDSHREAVAKIQWVKASDSRGTTKYNIMSVSSDGRMLVWVMDKAKAVLNLANGYILLTESLPKSMKKMARRGDLEMGVTCMSFSSYDDTSFLIGSESGGVFKCSTNYQGMPARREITCSVPLHSPVTFCYSPHSGPVYSVEASPYHRNVFLTCGTDNTINIYSLLQQQPVHTIEPAAGYLYSVKWSPVRPLVFGAATESGSLFIYDLQHSRVIPLMKLEGNERKIPLYTMSFNKKQANLLATGDGMGFIQIWQLNDDLIKPTPNEHEVLDDMAAVAKDES